MRASNPIELSPAPCRPGRIPHRRVVIASYLARSYGASPYGAAVLASHLEDWAAAQSLEISDEVMAFPHDMPASAAADAILARHPTLIGISVYVWNYTRSLEIVERIRTIDPDVVIALGGPHISRDDPNLQKLLHAGAVDFCVLGEGEVAFTRIVAGEPLAPFVDGGTVDFSGRTSPYVTQPLLAADLAETGVAIIEGARGCPFSCTFCDQGWRRARLADNDTLHAELSMLYGLGARHYIFLDPTFNYHRARMHSLLAFLRDELPGATFGAELKVELLNDADIALLKDVCTVIEAGLQSSNPDTLKRIRRHENVERLWMNVRSLNEADIQVAVNTIFGLPGDSITEWLTTVDNCYANSTDSAITATCLKVLPNTEIWGQRHKYEYTWDEQDLFRATSSSTMSRAEFAEAERLGKLLQFLHRPGPSISDDAKSYINQQRTPLLSSFLRGLSGGRILAVPDQARQSGYSYSGVAALGPEPAAPRAATLQAASQLPIPAQS